MRQDRFSHAGLVQLAIEGIELTDYPLPTEASFYAWLRPHLSNPKTSCSNAGISLQLFNHPATQLLAHLAIEPPIRWHFQNANPFAGEMAESLLQLRPGVNALVINAIGLAELGKVNMLGRGEKGFKRWLELGNR